MRVSAAFRDDLGNLINRHSMENGSNTPDFMLAEYLCHCLEAWNHSVAAREKWYGRAPIEVPKPTIAELEAILQSNDERKVEILPDGSVTVRS